MPTDDTHASIYAEVHSNIRQLSVTATLPSPVDATTRATVFKDNGDDFICIQHHGQVTALSLPARVLPQLRDLPVASQRPGEVAWRLPLLEQHSQSSHVALEDQAVPWSSGKIQPGSGIACRKCSTGLVKDGTITVWKDLPSENWAEMMEFWHCHKPHDHKAEDSLQSEEALTSKGYGANSSIRPQESVGFVDIGSFLLSWSDCQNISTSQHDKAGQDIKSEEASAVASADLLCNACSVKVGLLRDYGSSVNLFKWAVTCKVKTHLELPSSLHCLAATLIASISRSGSSKSVIIPQSLSPNQSNGNSNTSSSLHLWVLNPNITYGSTSRQGKQSAMKVLWKVIDTQAGIEMSESMTSDVQDFNLPVEVVTEAIDALTRSSSLLPSNDRKFQDWNVGLLSRWNER